MFEVLVSLSAGSRSFSHRLNVADKVGVRKVEKAITSALKALNDASANSAVAPPGPAADVEFSYSVTKSGQPYCKGSATWSHLVDAQQAFVAETLGKVGKEAKAVGKV